MSAVPKPLKAAAADLLRSGEWVGLDAAVEALAGSVPDADALKVADRLSRFSAANRDTNPVPAAGPARAAWGRRRATQDALNRLVTDGRAEATGAGDARQWRGSPSHLGGKPERRTVPLSALTFDRRLQMRDLPGGEGLYDEATVRDYLEVLSGGRDFKGLIEAVDDRGDVLWVYDGFQRGEAYRRHGTETVEIIVYPGRLGDARLRAFAANGGHGKSRTPADKYRAVNELLDDPALLARVLGRSASKGGGLDAIKAACSLGSTAIVEKVLKARGQRFARVGAGGAPKLVPVEPPAAPRSVAGAGPEPAAEPDDAADPLPTLTEDEGRAFDRNLETANAADRGREIVALSQKVGRLFAALYGNRRADRDRVRDLFVRAAAEVGCPVEFAETIVDRPIGHKGGEPVGLRRTPLWPPAFQAEATAKLFLSQLEGGEVVGGDN